MQHQEEEEATRASHFEGTSAATLYSLLRVQPLANSELELRRRRWLLAWVLLRDPFYRSLLWCACTTLCSHDWHHHCLPMQHHCCPCITPCIPPMAHSLLFKHDPCTSVVTGLHHSCSYSWESLQASVEGDVPGGGEGAAGGGALRACSRDCGRHTKVLRVHQWQLAVTLCHLATIVRERFGGVWLNRMNF